MANQQAPKGSIFKCLTCGKVSETRYGFPVADGDVCKSSRGYDESCMMNCVLVPISSIAPSILKSMIERS